MKKLIIGVLVFLSTYIAVNAENDIEFYSRAADEYIVQFSGELKTEFKSLDQIKKFSAYQKSDVDQYLLYPTLKYIFGPLTHRSLGGEQKGFSAKIRWNQAELVDGLVVLPYDYSGQWLINKRVKDRNFQIPVPYSYKLLRTENWKNCGDEDPQHQDLQSFWYYWDPSRFGCDHKVNVHYQMINPVLSQKTQQTVQSFPEYQNMIVDNKMKMTFAFGYVENPANPNPYKDSDAGVYEFRRFISLVKNDLSGIDYKEEAIFESRYLGAVDSKKRIGTQFNFNRRGIDYEVKVVAAADIDQMELFAQSFSAEHDSFFGWYGHSRVGNGFDASRFNSMLMRNRQYYSLSPNYQMIYWAGCNSYSYYTKPFFDFKANLREQDPNGTKSLDIISNGLPSYFSLNALNAEVMFKAMLYFEKKSSYQEIISDIEQQSNLAGAIVLVNVLGDEDNAAIFD